MPLCYVENNLVYARDDDALVKQSPWTPADVSTVMWFDATDDSTIVTSASTFVEEWEDKSGNDNHSGSGGGATTYTRTLNNLNVIDFDGSLNYLNAENDVTRTNDYIVIGVWDVDANTCLWGQGGSQASELCNDRFRLYTDGITNFSSGAFTGAHIFSLDINFSGTTTTAYVDDVQEGTDTMTTATGSSTFRIGSNVTAGNRLNGATGEIIMTNDRTQDTVDRLTGYLAWKWGLVGNLPSDHPYKNEPPLT